MQYSNGAELLRYAGAQIAVDDLCAWDCAGVIRVFFSAIRLRTMVENWHAQQVVVTAPLAECVSAAVFQTSKM